MSVRSKRPCLILDLANHQPVAHIIGVDDKQEDDSLIQLADGVAKHERKRQHDGGEEQPNFLDIHLSTEHLSQPTCLKSALVSQFTQVKDSYETVQAYLSLDISQEMEMIASKLLHRWMHRWSSSMFNHMVGPWSAAHIVDDQVEEDEDTV